MARTVVPIVKTAGMAARDGARNAAAWTAPRIQGARAWTAPRIERSGLAIKDTIAPKICAVFVATARRVDVPAPRLDVTAHRRRRANIMAGATVLVATAAAAAAAVVLRRRKNEGTLKAPGEAAEAGTGTQIAQDGQPRAGADGSGAEEDVSSQFPAT
jgi:hypothetical protein